MLEAALLRDNPAVRIAQVYEDIWRTRMADVPILNDRLRVEAVGFRQWQGQWLGALITPWSINLLLLPGDGAWTSLAAGDERFVSFPAGRFRFICAHVEPLGESHGCSLFSPVLEFTDHEAARLTAEAALVALFDPAHAPAADELLRENKPEPVAATVSKRDFLSGKVSGRNRGQTTVEENSTVVCPRFSGAGHGDRG